MCSIATFIRSRISETTIAFDNIVNDLFFKSSNIVEALTINTKIDKPSSIKENIFKILLIISYLNTGSGPIFVSMSSAIFTSNLLIFASFFLLLSSVFTKLQNISFNPPQI